MLLSNTSAICEIILLHHVSFIHVHHDRPEELVADVSARCEFSAQIQSRQCFGGSHKGVASETVLLIADAPSDFEYEALQQTCYPSAGIWCLLRDGFLPDLANLSVCDIFLLVEYPPNVKHVIFETQGLTIFTWTPGDSVCNKAGIFMSQNVGFKSDFSGLVLRRMDEYFAERNSAYDGKPDLARKVSSKRNGIVQGFEYSLMRDLEEYLNFTTVNRLYGKGTTKYGQEPERDTYWGNSILGYVVRREVHFCYGDLSVLFPRSLFIDFTYTHDVDEATFLAKVDVKLFTGGHLLELVRGPVSACYMICVSFLSFWLAFDRVGRPTTTSTTTATVSTGLFAWASTFLFKLVEVLMALASYVVQPVNNGRLLADFRGTSAFLIGLWKVCMLWLVIVFSSELTSIVTKPHVVGVCDTIAEIARVLKTVPRARVYTLDGFKEVFHESAGLDPKREIKVIVRYMEAYEDEADVVDSWRFSRVSFLFGESISLRRSVWKFNMGDFTYQSAEHTYNAYQAIGFQKGCVLQLRMNAVVQQLVETGHVRHYKNKAGLHLENHIRVPTARRAISLFSVTSLFLVVGFSYGLCIVVLLAEVFVKYDNNRPTVPLQYYTLRVSVHNAEDGV